MKNIVPIAQEAFNTLQMLKQTTNSFKQNIENRLDYILTTVFNSCGDKLRNWYIDGAAEGELGDIDSIISNNCINTYNLCYDSVKNVKADNFLIILDNEKWQLLERIPQYWLFENFEQDLRDGLVLYRDQLKNKKEATAKQRATNKRQKEKLIELARTKLTVEEQKAVGIFKRKKK